MSVYQIAIAWALRRPEIVATPKAASVAHVRENAGAADIVATPADLESIDEAYLAPAAKVPLAML